MNFCRKIYFNVYADTPKNTGIVSYISLDGGSYWHELTDAEYEEWIDVSDWDEYESFNSLNNIKIKISLSSNGDDTPLVDDYLIQWKVQV